MFLCQSGILPFLCQFRAILAKLLDKDFKFFFLAFTLTLIYKPILNSIRPELAILSPKILQKITKMAISQNHILLKCHSPKSLLLLHFSMNLSETFRINVNMDFAKYYLWPIFNLGLQKKLYPSFCSEASHGSVLHVWTQNCLQNFGTCLGRPLQLITRNHFFQSERPKPPPPPPPPPLIWTNKLIIL